MLAMGMIFAVYCTMAALVSRRRWRLDEVLLTAFCALVWLVTRAFTRLYGHHPRSDFGAPFASLSHPTIGGWMKPWLNAGIMFAVVAGVVFFFPSATQPKAKSR